MRYTGMASGGAGFNPYAVGRKTYGAGRSFPTSGKVDPLGYRERDALAKSRRDAMLKKLRANLSKNYGSPASLRDLGA